MLPVLELGTDSEVLGLQFIRNFLPLLQQGPSSVAAKMIPKQGLLRNSGQRARVEIGAKRTLTDL